jgi:hypothetical protein
VAAAERWWTADPRERYWLEVSARGEDVGVDLNALHTFEAATVEDAERQAIDA